MRGMNVMDTTAVHELDQRVDDSKKHSSRESFRQLSG
jgi:hypothetical protein